MMNTVARKRSSQDIRYLLLDSTYRDRYLYPDPANYTIPFQKFMGNSINTSVNPVTIVYPIFNFQWTTNYYPGDGSSVFSGTIIGGSNTQPMLDASIDLFLGARGFENPYAKISATFEQLNGALRQLSFYYDSDEEDTNQYIVLEYDPINRVVTLDRPIPKFTIGKKYSLKNLSTPSRIILQGYNLDRLGTGSNNTGALISSSTILYLYDIALQEMQRVIFDGLTGLVCANNGSFGSGWKITDAYLLFIDKAPTAWGMIEPMSVDPIAQYIKTNSVFQWSLSNNGMRYMQNDVVKAETCSQDSSLQMLDYAKFQVSRVGNLGEILEMDILYPGSGYCCGGMYRLLPVMRDNQLVTTPVIPYDSTATIRVTQTLPYLVVDSNELITPNTYFMPMIATSMFTVSSAGELQTSPTDSIPPNIPRNVRKMFNHNVQNGSSTQSDANALYGTYPIERVFNLGTNKYGIQIDTGSSQTLNRVELITPESETTFDPYLRSFIILNFERDFCVPLNYSGSTVSSNQMVCYGMRIVSLILPNQQLYTPYGGLTSSYPFVFVELCNDSAPSGHNKFTIYANNPFAINNTFICHISDVNSPLITKYIKLFSDGSHQMIKFKPNDNLRFRVSLPNGDTFTTQRNDYLPPLLPNPLLQLTCLVEMIRLD